MRVQVRWETLTILPRKTGESLCILRASSVELLQEPFSLGCLHALISFEKSLLSFRDLAFKLLMTDYN